MLTLLSWKNGNKTKFYEAVDFDADYEIFYLLEENGAYLLFENDAYENSVIGIHSTYEGIQAIFSKYCKDNNYNENHVSINSNPAFLSSLIEIFSYDDYLKDEEMISFIHTYISAKYKGEFIDLIDEDEEVKTHFFLMLVKEGSKMRNKPQLSIDYNQKWIDLSSVNLNSLILDEILLEEYINILYQDMKTFKTYNLMDNFKEVKNLYWVATYNLGFLKNIFKTKLHNIPYL